MRLSLTGVVRGKTITAGLALVLGVKTWILNVFSQYSAFCLQFIHSEARMPSPAKLFKKFRATDPNGCLNLSLSWEHLRTHLKDHTRYDQGTGSSVSQGECSPLVGEDQFSGCLKVWVSGPLEWDAEIQWLCARRHSRHSLWGVSTCCDTKLVRSTQLLSRPEIGLLCVVFWHQQVILIL